MGKAQGKPIWVRADLFQSPFAVDGRHCPLQKEKRFYILGRTDAKRKLFIAFTWRGNLIRMISARDISRKELEVYDNA